MMNREMVSDEQRMISRMKTLFKKILRRTREQDEFRLLHWQTKFGWLESHLGCEKRSPTSMGTYFRAYF